MYKGIIKLLFNFIYFYLTYYWFFNPKYYETNLVCYNNLGSVYYLEILILFLFECSKLRFLKNLRDFP